MENLVSGSLFSFKHLSQTKVCVCPCVSVCPSVGDVQSLKPVIHVWDHMELVLTRIIKTNMHVYFLSFYLVYDTSMAPPFLLSGHMLLLNPLTASAEIKTSLP